MIVESYSVDGIALENPALGWVFRAPSRPLAGLTVRRPSLQVPGLPGVVRDPARALESLEAPMPSLMVQTPRENYDALLSLLADGSVLSITDQPHREAIYELVSTSQPEGYGRGDEILDVTATLQLPGVFWRDTSERTVAQALTAGTNVFDPWHMTGLVTDAVIRVRGPVTGLRIVSGRATLEYEGTIAAGSFLRYNSAANRAVITTSDTWTGGSSVNGQIDADGPGDKFAVFPTRLDPFNSTARLTITGTSIGAGAQIEVRGKGAYIAF